MYSIRKAREQDIPALLRLLVQVNMVHHLGRPDLFKGPATKYTREELQSLLLQPDTPVFVCVDGQDQVLGYAFCVIRHLPQDHILTPIKTLYVDDLCVEEACRGQHIGRQLYFYVRDFAREIGCYNVTLNVWALNPGALKFYERCGMKPQKIGMEDILSADGEG